MKHILTGLGVVTAFLPLVVFAQAQVAFLASPTSGSAPLTVSFSSALANAYPANFYYIDFGDGQTSNKSKGLGTISHAYITAGSYTATLYSATNACANTTDSCTQPNLSYVAVGTASLTVSSSNNNYYTPPTDYNSYCSPGYTYQNGWCVQTPTTTTVTCPSGYSLVNGACVQQTTVYNNTTTASRLSASQSQAILNLLAAFGVDSATIQRVSIILRGY